jgi:hypothetical protein
MNERLPAPRQRVYARHDSGLEPAQTQWGGTRSGM